MRRDAIIEATIRVVGRKGYRATTVGDVIAEAGVARTTFYKHFDDKHECFVAAYELTARRTLAAIESGCDEEGPWPDRARAGLASLVELLAADPSLARLVVVEAAVAGVEGRRRQLALLERCAELLERGREASPSGASPRPEPPEAAGPMAAGAVAGLLFDEIQAGRATELRQRLPDLLFALLVPYLGPQEAAASARPWTTTGWRSSYTASR